MNKTETEYAAQCGSTFTKGFIIGALLGAAAALLYAPKPGRELRSELTDRFNVATNQTKEVTSIVCENATNLAKNVTDKTTELTKSIGNGANTVISSIKETSADIVEDIRNASQELTVEAKQASEDTDQVPNYV